MVESINLKRIIITPSSYCKDLFVTMTGVAGRKRQTAKILNENFPIQHMLTIPYIRVSKLLVGENKCK